MKKLYNVIFPVWLVIIFPPILFLVLTGNFIIDSLVLLLGFKIFKMTNFKKNYKKFILKVYLIGFASDLLGISLLFLCIILSEFIIPASIVSALMLNPFTNIFATLYCILVITISGYLIYIFNKKITFKKEKNKHKLSLLIAIITAPYLFLLPTDLFLNDKNNIESFSDTSIEDDEGVKEVLGQVLGEDCYSNIIIDKLENPYGLVISYTCESNYFELEKNSAVLINLINEIEFVTYVTKEDTYTFDLVYLNNILEDVKEMTVHQIYNNYSKKYYEYKYLGTIGEYSVFDKSITCISEDQLLYENQEKKYYINCSDINEIYLEGNETYTIKSAIELNVISIEDLKKLDLTIIEEEKDENFSE